MEIRDAAEDSSPYSTAPAPSGHTGSAEWIHKARLKLHQRVRNSTLAALRFFLLAYNEEAGCGVCPLTLGVSSPSVPPRSRADRDGGFAVWFGSRGSIDSFKVESTCHCFNHPWPRLHVGGPQRGTGSAAAARARVCARAAKRKRKDEADIERG